MKVSAIVPSKGKQAMLLSMLRSLRNSETNPNRLEIIVVIEEDHNSAVAVEKANLDAIVIDRAEHRGPIFGWNEGAGLATGDAFALIANDCWIMNDWRRASLEKLKELNWHGMVGFNNCNGLDNSKGFVEHFLASRSYCEKDLGGVVLTPHYKHFYVDIEMWERAVKAGKYIYAPNAKIEHRHWRYHKSNKEDYVMDCDCKRGDDKIIFDERKKNNYPIDYYPML